MIKRRMMALLLSVGMLLSVVGCGAKETAETTKTPETPAATEEVAEEKEEVQEIQTVKWMMFELEEQADNEEVMAELNKITEERYGIHIDFEFVNYNDYDQRVQLMSTSGEDFDIMFVSNWKNDFDQNYGRGALLALDDLLASDAGELLRSALPEGHTGVAMRDGATYAIPNYQSMTRKMGYFIDKELADEYGLDTSAITSEEDIEPFLAWVAENHSDKWIHLTNNAQVPNDYEQITTNVWVNRTDDTMTAVNKYETEAWQAQQKRNIEWAKAGYLRPDMLTKPDDADYQTNGNYVVWTDIDNPGNEVDFSTSKGREYVKASLSENTTYLNSTAGADTMTAINVNSKNPEAAIKAIGIMWSDADVMNLWTYGIEGKHYELSDEGLLTVTGEGYGRTGQYWAVGNTFLSHLKEGQDPELWDKTMEWNGNATRSKLAGFVFNSEPVQTELAQISVVESEFKNVLTYADDYDAKFEELQEKLELAGMQKVVDEVNKQISEWKAANGK